MRVVVLTQVRVLPAGHAATGTGGGADAAAVAGERAMRVAQRVAAQTAVQMVVQSRQHTGCVCLLCSCAC